MHHALTGATTQDGTDIPLMKDKLARATWSFKGHGALSDVDTKQNSSRLNGTRRPLCSRTALRLLVERTIRECLNYEARQARRHASASKALMAYALHAEIRLDDPGAALAAQLEIDAR